MATQAWFLVLLFAYACSLKRNSYERLGRIVIHGAVSMQSPFIEAIPHWQRCLQHNQSLLLIDGDNLRGKTMFSVSKRELLERLQQHLTVNQIPATVYLYYDHGLVQETIPVPNSTISVVFSGPAKSADDVIAQQVQYFQQLYQKDVVLVTEDHELQQRCRVQSTDSRTNKKKFNTTAGAAAPRAIHLVSSPTFAEVLFGEELPLLTINRRKQHTTSPSMQSSYGFVNIADLPSRDLLTGIDEEATIMLQRTRYVMQLLISLQEVHQKLLIKINAHGVKQAKQQSKRMIERLQGLSERLRYLLGQTPILDSDISIVDNIQTIASATIQHCSVVLRELRERGRISDVEDNWERRVLAEEFRLYLRSFVLPQ